MNNYLMDSYCKLRMHNLTFKKLIPLPKGLRYLAKMVCPRCGFKQNRIYERKDNVWWYDDVK